VEWGGGDPCGRPVVWWACGGWMHAVALWCGRPAVALGVVGPCGCPVQLVISEQPYAAHLPALLMASSRKRFPKPDNYKDVL